jgi:DNA polymerase-3 subunit epsilon
VFADLASLDVLILDAQATGARGHLLELGWARVAPHGDPPRAVTRLVRLPPGERLPRRVAMLTGLSAEALAEGVDPLAAWRDLATFAASIATGDVVPTVIHYARFEAPFLADLAAQDDASPRLDIVCAHAVARRLLPDLPRCTLRALAGYFGHPLEALRRSGEHVEATASVWRSLITLLAEQESVRTWDDLRAWLAGPRRARTHRAYPMPREVRLALPNRPGLYRMLRQDGSVLYVGKATSLRSRVNSYFRRQSGGAERTLEMLSQARSLSFTVTESALEAALLEPDEIKLHRPPYNVALREEGRTLWFASDDFRSLSPHPDRAHRIGPLTSRDHLPSLAALARALAGDARATPAEILGIPERWAPPRDILDAALSLFAATHGDVVRTGCHALLALGTRLWADGWRERAIDEDADAPEEPAETVSPAGVAWAMERLVVLAAHAIRRARWLCRLADCGVAWREEGIESAARILVVERGEVILRAGADAVTAPVPPGSARSSADRRRALANVATFDRLRVLTTELRRVVAEGGAAEIGFGEGRVASGERLARALARM